MITTWLAFIEALGVPSITCGNITIHIADGRPQKWEITQTGKIARESDDFSPALSACPSSPTGYHRFGTEGHDYVCQICRHRVKPGKITATGETKAVGAHISIEELKVNYEPSQNSRHEYRDKCACNRCERTRAGRPIADRG